MVAIMSGVVPEEKSKIKTRMRFSKSDKQGTLTRKDRGLNAFNKGGIGGFGLLIPFRIS